MRMKDIKPGDTAYVWPSAVRDALARYSDAYNYPRTHRLALVDRVVEDAFAPMRCTVLEVRLPYFQGSTRKEGVLIELPVRPCTEHDIWECQRVVGGTIRVLVARWT